MVKIPDRLDCLFTTAVDQRDDSYHIEIPQDEVEQEAVRSGETYRVAILPSPPRQRDTDSQQQNRSAPTSGSVAADSQPPVAEGDVREVTIETIGDQGDGIAKVARGYVVIVPEAEPGDEVTVGITHARENVAFAQVCDETDENTSEESGTPEESVEGDTLDEPE